MHTLAAVLHIFERQNLGKFSNSVVSKGSSPNFAFNIKRI